MYQSKSVMAIIPALNEENAIGKVVSELIKLTHNSTAIIDHVIVCDNGSSDNTASTASSAGAQVVRQEQPGYGIACLTAMQHLPHCDIVLFVDGDDSCYIKQTQRLLDGIISGDDLAIGSRTLGHIEKGALTVPQRWGNALATFLIQGLWHRPITDLGPFRAIRYPALQHINMQDKQFGWTVEMQVKCIQHHMQVNEYAVDSKVRIGHSKISGTLKGTIKAGIGILGMIATLRIRQQKLLAQPYKPLP